MNGFVENGSHKSSSPYTVLVTGANTGLGFTICCRLVDEFLTRNLPHLHAQHLLLILTTRSERKGQDAVDQLSARLAARLRKEDLKFPGISHQWSQLIHFRHEVLDLNSIVSVQQLARRLYNEKRSDRKISKLDAIICNAGIGGWTGVNFPYAVMRIILDLKDAVTYPEFKISGSGWVTKPQIDADKLLRNGQLSQNGQSDKDLVPAVGEVFCANAFGHYLLTHYLHPLLSPTDNASPPGRIIWLSTMEAHASAFSPSDLQAISSIVPYESSKRLTDILALSSSSPTVSHYTSTYSSPSPSILSRGEHGSSPTSHNQPRPIPEAARPKHYIAHPGVCGTGIMPLHSLLVPWMMLVFRIARWCGSPWHTVAPYLGAVAPVWLALASSASLDEIEQREGKGKWGSSTDRAGNERVLRTFVEGWGWGGREGEKVIQGRRKRLADVTREEREAFEEIARETWKGMEELRVEWEKRIQEAGL